MKIFTENEIKQVVEVNLASDDVIELGKLVVKQQNGRMNAEEILVCDLTGTGVQDMMIVLYAYQKLTGAGLGITIKG